MDPDKLNLLGHEEMQKGQVDTALEYFLKAIEANSLLPQSHYNAGVCYMARGEYEKAISFYKKALLLSPKNTIILNNIGITYGKMDNQSMALKYYKEALKYEPDNIFSLSNIGSIYVKDDPKKAKAYLLEAIKINPHLSDSYFNLGICLSKLNDSTSAIKYFEKAIKLDPTYSPTYGHLHYELRRACEYEKAREVYDSVTKVNKSNIKNGILPAQTPFEAVVFNDNLKENFDIARIWSNYIANQQTKKAYTFVKKTKKEKIRIGFLSSDFNNHATSYLLIGLFGSCNKESFDYFTYSYGVNDKSDYRKIIESFTKFRDCQNFSDIETADIINRDKIDILIDLKGYTQNSRLGILAHRPSPIQVTWLGFPGTTGASFIDYMITDEIVTAKKDASFYSENLIFMPHTYQATSNQQNVAQGMKRSDFSLPTEGFLFCSFNQSYKIDEKTLALWVNILKRVPDGILCLLEQSKNILRSNIIKRSNLTKRIAFLPSLPKDKHLARIALCDLALDTFICNGHTTTSDSLWAGTPVITLKGNHFASRVSASLLTTIGLPELITNSSKEYENLAVLLAKSPKLLKSIRYSLYANRYSYPLFDTVRFTKNFESGMTAIFQKYLKDELPNNVYIKDKIGKDVLSMSQSNLGALFMEEKNYEKAILLLQKAIKLNPKNSLSYNNLGTALKESGKPNEAVVYWKKALAIDPKFIESLSNLGIYYLDAGNQQKARGYFFRIIKINPNDASAYNNLGVSFLNQSSYQEAITNFEKSIDINPSDYACLYHLGLTYRLNEDYENSIKYLKKSLELNPDYGPALNIYTLVLMQTCNWKELDVFANKIPPEHESPYINVARTNDQELNLKVAKLRSTEIEKNVKDLIKPFKYVKKTKKLKIGYLSRDYFEHATAYLIEGLFSGHDKNKFETYAYSYGPNDGSFYRKKFEQEADHFIDISNMGHLEAAKKINLDKIDILIDLKGHTKDNRLEIMALKPSPIQVSYLGYPGTTGAKFIDFIITDKIVTPKEYQKYYTEKFAYMPDSYQINYDKRKIADVEYKREDFGLPKNKFIFSCFNHTSKIDEKTFSSWMNILKRVPNSVLWLLGSNEIAEENLKKEAKIAKVDPNRLIFAKHIENSHHLARIALSNLSLDTFTYNGHTTTSDSLWAGVPVITLQGKHFASRVASSLLSAVGLPELITRNPKQYENLIIKIVNDKKLNDKLKQKLEENRLTKPLFNTKLFVKNLQELYLKMYGSRI